MTIFQALICGIWIFMRKYMPFYWTSIIFGCPLFTGMVLGAILGDWKTGAAVGIAVQPMYLINYGIGGVSVNDSCVAGVVPTALVVCSGMSLEAAVSLAVPFGLLAGQFGTLVMVVLGAESELVTKAAAEGNAKKVAFYGSFVPVLIKFVMFVGVFTPLLYFGGDAAANIINSLPAWANAGLTCITHVLPGLGYAMIMNFIGRSELLPYFFAGFIFASYSGINSIGIACLGLFLAWIHVQIQEAKGKFGDDDEDDDDEEEVPKNRILTKADVRRFWVGCWYYGCQSHNTLTMHAAGLGIPMARIAEKLYADDPEEMKACMQRHVMPYITNFNLGGIVNCALLSMEEQRAIDRDSMSGEAITSMKYALAGPVAAIGDTLDSVCFMTILYGLGTSLAAEGNYWACIVFPLLLVLWTTIEIYLSSMAGYNIGSKAAMTVLTSKKVKLVIEFASVVGMFTLAGVAAGMVNVKFAITIGDGFNTTAIQSIFDAIMPKCLSLGTMFAMYTFLHKGGKTSTLLYIVLIASFVLGALGILA